MLDYRRSSPYQLFNLLYQVCIPVFLSQHKPWTEQYFWALFKALSHMLCIGYGRHPPQNIPETCVTISSMMTGATFYALFIAYSINVIQTMDSPGRSYKEKVSVHFTRLK